MELKGLNLDQFSVENNKKESNFKEQFTIEEIKAAVGAPFQCSFSKNFFMCGKLRGYISKPLAEKVLANTGEKINMVISHVVSDNFNGLMLHEEGANLIEL